MQFQRRCCGLILVAFFVCATLSLTSATVWAQAEITHGSEVATDHGDAGHAGGEHEHGEHADTGHGETGHGDGGHGGDVNPVTLDPDLAIVTAVIFAILLAVLWKFAWGPIVTALDTRERTVAEQLADAKRSQEEAKRMLADHERQLSGAAAEVKSLLDQARKDAELHKQEVLEAAQAAATAEKDRALREIQAAKNAALQDLAGRSVETAVDLAGKIVRRQLTSEDHSQLVGDALQRFSGSN